MADRHGYGSRGCYVDCATTLGNFSTTQLCRCQNLLAIFHQRSHIPHSCTSRVSKSWIRSLSGRPAGGKRIQTRSWSSCAACVLFFFLQLALYPANSALLVDSAHPSFCVPSSFHWLDLRRLFEGNPNGFRQLLELVWTPEALTKSTLFPSPHGDGKRCNKQWGRSTGSPWHQKAHVAHQNKITFKNPERDIFFAQIFKELHPQ